MQARDYEKLPPEAKAIILEPGNKLYDQLMAELKKRKRYVKTAAEVRRLADAELGDKTLTEVLYEMRNEAIQGIACL